MDKYEVIFFTGKNRKAFSCGKKMLDDYFYYQAGQDIKRRLTVCFVRTDTMRNILSNKLTAIGRLEAKGR